MASEPIHEIRFGLIKCRIFLRRTRTGDRYNVSVTRLYRNGDSWSESHYFGRDEALLASKVLDLAHSWIFQHTQAVESPASDVTSE